MLNFSNKKSTTLLALSKILVTAQLAELFYVLQCPTHRPHFQAEQKSEIGRSINISI